MEKKKTVIDLFAGAGGLSKAFENAGADIIFANDIDVNACKIYKYNFPNTLIENQSIQNIKSEAIPEVDIIIGGFPCQSFSNASHFKGKDDRRELLFYEIIRIIKEKRPKAIFLETVKGFKIINNGNSFKILVDELKHYGYFVQEAILNSNEFGNVPYSKERFYIVAFREVKCFEVFDFPSGIELTNSSIDIINIHEKKADVYYYGRNIERLKADNDLVIRKGVFYQFRYKKGTKNCVYESENCPTILLYSYNVPMILDDYGIRMLTPEECFRIQGFYNIQIPENVNNKILYKYASSCSAVTVVERIAEKMLIALEADNCLAECRDYDVNNSKIYKDEQAERNITEKVVNNKVVKVDNEEQIRELNRHSVEFKKQEIVKMTNGIFANNEEQFTKIKVIPALKKYACFDVKYNHGNDEYGRDIIYKYVDNFKTINWGAAQIKFGDISGEVNGKIDTILNQISDAFKMPYIDVNENTEPNIRQVLIICSGKFTKNAKEKIRQKMDKAYNVRFLDGQDIDNLLEEKKSI